MLSILSFNLKGFFLFLNGVILTHECMYILSLDASKRHRNIILIISGIV